MDFKEIKELIEAVNSSDISFFELTINDAHIKMDKSLNREILSEKEQDLTTNVVAKEVAEKVACTALETKIKDEEEVTEDNFSIVKSPMVGTFYSAPSEDSEDFVKCGDKVSKGDVLCIIEAMKLMNEIECDYSGTIKEILVKNGDMVEYGQPIFKIKED